VKDIIFRASEFAKRAHGSIDQRRKFTNEPYIIHPEAVAKLVSSVTNDANVISASWLHDVVEDTPVTIENIYNEFGEVIGSLVASLTDISKASDGNRAKRKSIDRLHISLASPGAKTIKLADIIDNLSGLSAFKPAFAKVFHTECAQLHEVLKAGDSKLYLMAADLIKDTEV
jgi:(p)ppGpp synthase/HD superfamily hydrolase